MSLCFRILHRATKALTQCEILFVLLHLANAVALARVRRRDIVGAGSNAALLATTGRRGSGQPATQGATYTVTDRFGALAMLTALDNALDRLGIVDTAT